VVGKTNLTGEKIGWFDAKAGVLGMFFVIAGLAGAFYAARNGFNDVIIGFIAPLSFYPDSITLLSVQLGVCFLLFSLCRAIFDKAPKDTMITGYCRLLSKYSLTIYVFHYIVVLWPVWIMGAIKGDLKRYYQNAISVPAALVCAIILLVLFFFIFSRWNRREGKYSLEWILGRVVP
jgi:peptidoglycan/LPS O-acetylase OafA/YrhL